MELILILGAFLFLFWYGFSMKKDKEKKDKDDRALLYDVAYGCFLFCGLVLLSLSAMEYVPMDEFAAARYLFVVTIPLLRAVMVVMPIGIVLGVILWQDRVLLILSVMSVLFIGVIFFEYGSSAFQNAVFIVYGIGVVVACGVWFLNLIRKLW